MKRSLFFSTISLLIIAFLFIGWQQNKTSQDKYGMIYSDPASDKDGKIKILILYDMEGLSGQDNWRSLLVNYPDYYEPARELLTNDVNAVIEGLYNGGADVVHVIDAHGSGNPKPDILLDRMDSRAEFLDKGRRFRPYVDLVDEDVYDAVVLVAMHARTGGGGFCSHTYTLGMDWILNGRSINESEINIFSWGRVDVPVIFVSGDDKLKGELEPYPWIEYVRVKNATSASSADLRPVDEVHAEMKTAAKKAVENMSGAKAVKLKTPIKASLRAVPPARLNMLDGVPGIHYNKRTVTFLASDYMEAYDGITALIGVATLGYQQILQRTVRKQDNARKINDEFVESLFIRWIDVESGRVKVPNR